VILAAVAVLVAAWFAVLLRDFLLIRQVNRIVVAPHLSAAQLRHAVSLARDSAFLNPNWSLPLISEAVVDQAAGDTAAMIRVYRTMVRVQPKDADVWYLLAAAARQSDPALAARADARVRALDPRF
jgi:hypothetical protein